MQPFRNYLKEIKLSRAYKHFSTDGYPVGVITAFRDANTYEQNTKSNKKLALELREAGYGYVYVDGGWKEDVGDGEKKDVEEDSIMVIGNPNDGEKLHDILLKEAKRYNQDGFLFKPEGEKSIYIVDQSGKREKISSKFRLDKFEYGYTKLRGGGKGKVFSFHEEREAVSGFGKRLENL